MEHDRLECAKEVIAARNRAFELMSPQARLMEVCQDVLRQLVLNPELSVRTGAYFVTSGKLKPGVVDLQEAIPCMDECRVCMLGALMFSKAALFDHASMIDLKLMSEPTSEESWSRFEIHRDRLAKGLGDLGDQLVLNAMEAAFERSVTSVPVIDYRALRLMTLTERINDARTRAMIIARDIISNGGMLSTDFGYARDFYCSTFSRLDSDILFGSWFFSQKLYDRDHLDPEQLLIFPRNDDKTSHLEVIDAAGDRIVAIEDQGRYDYLLGIKRLRSDSYEPVPMSDRLFVSAYNRFFAKGRGKQYDLVTTDLYYSPKSDGTVPDCK